MITDDQIAFFKAFGFLFLPGLLKPDEMDAVGEHFDHWLEAEREGAPFPGETRQSLYAIAELEPLFTELVVDDRIYGTVEALLGEGFQWLGSEGNLYVGDTMWHPDGTRLEFRPMKVSLYLDPLTADTGCLRLIPGSHTMPFHEEVKPIAQSISGPDVPAWALGNRPGDVLFADMNTWHAAFGGTVGRRHLAVNFVPEPREEADYQVMRDNHDTLLGLIERLQTSQPRQAFTDAFLHHEHPRIQHITATWRDFGLR
jgi:hypothetical protein